MQKRSLEISCYVCGAGAFGVFFRWLQDQMAFDEAGLAERSVFNYLVPLAILAAALLFNRFIEQAKAEKLYIPTDYCQALRNEGRLFAMARWACGLVMALGGVLLIAGGVLLALGRPSRRGFAILCCWAAPTPSTASCAIPPWPAPARCCRCCCSPCGWCSATSRTP